MKIFYSTLGIIAIILLCHSIIIVSSGRNNIIFDLLLMLSMILLFCINIIGVRKSLEKIEIPVLISLVTSVFYYLTLLVFPIFYGSR